MWEVPEFVRAVSTAYKYRLAYVVNGVAACVTTMSAARAIIATWMARKSPYTFRGLERLLADFWRDVNKRR